MTPHIIFCGCFISQFVYKHSVVMVIKEDGLPTPGSGFVLERLFNLDFNIYGSYCCSGELKGKWQIKTNLYTFDLV